MSIRSKQAPPVLDLEGALSRLGGDSELFGELVGFLLEDVPPLALQLREAAGQDDAETIRKRAHALKGLVASCGGMRAVETAQRLEDAGCSGTLNDVQNLLGTLDDQLAELFEVLQQHRRSA